MKSQGIPIFKEEYWLAKDASCKTKIRKLCSCAITVIFRNNCKILKLLRIMRGQQTVQKLWYQFRNASTVRIILSSSMDLEIPKICIDPWDWSQESTRLLHPGRSFFAHRILLNFKACDFWAVDVQFSRKNSIAKRSLFTVPPSCKTSNKTLPKTLEAIIHMIFFLLGIFGLSSAGPTPKSKFSFLGNIIQKRSFLIDDEGSLVGGTSSEVGEVLSSVQNSILFSFMPTRYETSSMQIALLLKDLGKNSVHRPRWYSNYISSLKGVHSLQSIF